MCLALWQMRRKNGWKQETLFFLCASLSRFLFFFHHTLQSHLNSKYSLYLKYIIHLGITTLELHFSLSWCVALTSLKCKWTCPGWREENSLQWFSVFRFHTTSCVRSVGMRKRSPLLQWHIPYGLNCPVPWSDSFITFKKENMLWNRRIKGLNLGLVTYEQLELAWPQWVFGLKYVSFGMVVNCTHSANII